MRSNVLLRAISVSTFGLFTAVAGVLAGCSDAATSAPPAADPGDPTPTPQPEARDAGAMPSVPDAAVTADAAPAPEREPQAPKAVYTTSNDVAGNKIFVFTRAADGALTAGNAYSTGGKGTGAGLGDQGALVYDAATRRFFVVNAGDDSVSMMGLESDGHLTLIAKAPSGGVKPVSVTVLGDVVYVVNAGSASSPANVSGLRVAGAALAPIASSTQPLSTPTAVPAQIQFTPDGAHLVVTEKDTNKIDTFSVSDGKASAAMVQASSGKTPFGFAFGAGGHLIVSEAFGASAGMGATSSYALAANGALSSVSSSVVSAQTAPCWVAVAGDHAYVTNTRSNSVTAYTVAANGAITLSDANGVTGMTGAAPSDVDVSDSDDLLYVRNGMDASLSIFKIGANGALTKLPDFVGLPATAVGLVAR